jgi:hypothetical protein
VKSSIDPSSAALSGKRLQDQLPLIERPLGVPGLGVFKVDVDDG